jgi:hypothetical protein
MEIVLVRNSKLMKICVKQTALQRCYNHILLFKVRMPRKVSFFLATSKKRFLDNPGNPDDKAHHFVVIVGMGIDNDGKKFFRFFDS